MKNSEFIDLYVKNVNSENNESFTVNKIIENNQIIIILGSPGSGKTSILKKYQNANDDICEFMHVKKFIELTIDLKSTTKVLLLDGLDEYRSSQNEKTFTITLLGDKISKILNIYKDLKIVISCREMDWYGDADEKALKDEIKVNTAIYNIQPLDNNLQNKLSKFFKIDDSEKFIEKFSSHGLLENPQMFSMLANLWKEPNIEINSKKELYEFFIKKAKEQNTIHSQLIMKLEIDDIFKYSGYLAFFYMFCGVDEFNEEVIDQIVAKDKGYEREKVEYILNHTKLIKNHTFSHRTIAEYCLAHFLSINIKNLSINKERIKSLFIKSNKVPTELRGTFAWLCSITGDNDFISVDPYYQMIHGDNSLFNFEQKKDILKEVKRYSNKDPWFYKFGQTMQLEGFYSSELDEFLIEEFNNALTLKNHYIYVLINIFTQANNLTVKIKKFIKEKILDNKIHPRYKDDLISIFKNGDISFLKNILEKIKNKEIDDSQNYLKKEILYYLYPVEIEPSQIVEYLKLFKKEEYGNIYFLYKTKYEDKYKLIDSIFKNLKIDKDENIILIFDSLKSFIREYFLETLLKYNKEFTAKDIYEIIKHFRQYYDDYKAIKFDGYNYKLKDESEKRISELQILSNELFELYIEDLINECQLTKLRSCDFNFSYFFNYLSPNNHKKVFLSKIETELNIEIKKELFGLILSYSDRNKFQDIEILEKIAYKYNFNDALYHFKNPKKFDWQIEDEKRRAKQKEELLEKKRKNEEYFLKSDEKILSSFNDLYWISNIFYLVDKELKIDYLEKNTLLRLKGLLKRAIYVKLFEPELLTIDSLINNSLNAHRNIDTMYYTSLSLNSKFDVSKFSNEFKKYLYINALMHKNIGNVSKTKFLDDINKKEKVFVKDTLIEFIKLFINKYLYKENDLFFKYISNEKNLVVLEYIIMSVRHSNNSFKNDFLLSFINYYGFTLSIKELEYLNKFENLNFMINALFNSLHFKENIKYDINYAISLHQAIQVPKKPKQSWQFNSLHSDIRIKIISYMFFCFNTEKSIENVNGIQSNKDLCASFLSREVLDVLKLNELKELYKLHSSDDDIWSFRLLNQIESVERTNTDKEHGKYSIKDIKNFIINNEIISIEDFFEEVYLDLNKIKDVIEANEDNEKKFFYDKKDKSLIPKIENDCRDMLCALLKRYDEKYLIVREFNKANNRIDLHIKYKKKLAFEVQIECKKDDNTKSLYSGIEDQLIKKYFAKNKNFGIYLIFYFGSKNKKEMLENLKKLIPYEYKENIKVICIDLTFK
ncbi:MAG: NACHT domain-containing NTPase [Candidatus Altimarinota bacterium]